MRTIGAYEAKTHLPRLLDEVETGEEITITKHGRAVAVLVPVRAPRRREIDAAISGLRALRARQQRGPESLRDLIEDGRRR